MTMPDGEGDCSETDDDDTDEEGSDYVDVDDEGKEADVNPNELDISCATESQNIVNVESCNIEKTMVDMSGEQVCSLSQGNNTGSDHQGSDADRDDVCKLATPVPAHPGPSVAERYANLVRTEVVTVECVGPPEVATPVTRTSAPREESCTSNTKDRATVWKNSSSIPTQTLPPDMSSQTEWDLWGVPLMSANNTTISASACVCESNMRHFREWKREVERDAAAKNDHIRAKLNYLREQKIKADEDREKMKSTIASLTKTVAENAGYIAEMRIRTQRGGIPTKPTHRGSVTYQGMDEIVSCPEGQLMSDSRYDVGIYEIHCSEPPRPRQSELGGGRPGQNYSGGASARVPNKDMEKAPQNKSVSRAIVHCDPDPSSGDSDNNGQDFHVSTQNPSNDCVYDSGTTDGKSSQKGKMMPLPQRVPQGRAGNATQRAAASAKPSAAGSRANVQMNVSWADEPISDVEMVSMADATTPNNQRAPNTDVTPAANVSRTDILREALADSQMKEKRYRQQQQSEESGIGNNVSDKGEKRVRESSDSEGMASAKESYAGAASKEGTWNEVEYKKNKKKAKVCEPMLELLGSKTEPNKDIFVLMLDYSRCKRTEQLEGMVKRYCKNRDIEVAYAKAYQSKSDPMNANCKISVKQSDVNSVLTDGFWPGNAFARVWYSNNDFYRNKNTKSTDDEEQSD